MSYSKTAVIILPIVLLSYCLLYAQSKENRDQVKDEERVELPVTPGCECIKSINKLRRAEKAARKYGISISKAYRIDKKYTLSQKTISDALHCHCARQTSKKKGRQQPNSKKKELSLLSPGEVDGDCKVLLNLNHKFRTPLSFEEVTSIFRNLASQIGGDAVVITNYKKNKGATSKILQCNSKKIKEETFADIKIKSFPSYLFDPKTGLAWQRCSHGQSANANSCEGKVQRIVFSVGKKICPSLNPISGRHWRLPEVDELFTLVRKKKGKPRNYKNLLPGTFNEVYWSNTPYWNKAAIMGLDFESRKRIAYDKNKKGLVRCVIDLIPDIKLSEYVQ